MSLRTKNRIKEHSLVAGRSEVFKGTGELANRWCILFTCEHCDWIGWLPMDEVEEVITNGNVG